jgi:chitodextrinase
LTATAVSTNQINLTWSASTDTGGPGLAGYKVYRGGVQIATTTATNYSDSGLSPSTPYCYTVAAYDTATNTSAQSSQSCATTLAVAPAAPSGLTATAISTNQINLTWSASTDTGGPGLAGYKVYRGGAQIATTTTTNYSNTGLSPSTPYCYTVAAYDTATNTSAQSSQSCATTLAVVPAAPSGLTATAVSTNQINLTWSASTDTGGPGLAGYKIYRGGLQIATTTATNYSDSGLSPSTPYCYTVAAYDTATNTSAQSSQSCATTLAVVPAVPSGLTATAISTNQINLTWSASTDTGGPGLAGYKVYRGGAQIATTTTTNYSNTGLSPSTPYCYTVAAYDTATNTSAQSSQSCATTLASPETTAPTTSWAVSFKGTGYVVCSGVAVDQNGDVFVAGYFQQGSITLGGTLMNAGVPANIFVAKFSGATGSCLWANQFGNSWDNYAYGIAVETNGDVLVTGQFFGTIDFGGGAVTAPAPPGSDIFLLRLAGATGQYVWSKALGNGSSYPQIGYAVAVDPSNGNMLVTGQFSGGAVDFGGGNVLAYYGAETFLAEYSASGAYLWAEALICPSSNYGDALAIDSNSNVLLAGNFLGGGTVSVIFPGGGPTLSSQASQSIFLTKFSANGSNVWAGVFGSPGNGYNGAAGVASDGLGNVLLTGFIGGDVDFGGGVLEDSNGYNPFVAKFSSSNGSNMWSIAAVSTNSINESRGIAVDPSGNVLVTGQFEGTMDLGGGPLTSAGSNDVFLAEYSAASGTLLWSQCFGSTGDDFGYGVAVDAQGNILMTGMFSATVKFGSIPLIASGPQDGFLIKLAP